MNEKLIVLKPAIGPRGGEHSRGTRKMEIDIPHWNSLFKILPYLIEKWTNRDLFPKQG